MSKYRINVRFDLDKPKEANAAQYLQSLDMLPFSSPPIAVHKVIAPHRKFLF